MTDSSGLEKIRASKLKKHTMNFNIVFSSVLSIALLSGGTSITLANHPNPSQQQINLINTCTDTWKICVGAIVGLIGGRNFPTSNPNDADPTDRPN